MFYTYIHFKKDDGTPFYIGKGQKNRYCVKTNRNNYWKNIVSKHGFNAEILCNWSTEQEAFEHEKFLIQCFKNMNYELVNMTEGGEGTSGWIPSDSWRKKRSDYQKKNFVNPMFNEESKQKRTKTITGKLLSKEHKDKIGLSLIGNQNTKGKKQTEQSNVLRSKKLLGNKNGLGTIQTMQSNLQRSESLKRFWLLKKSSLKEST